MAKEDHYSADEMDRRLKAMLKGAFSAAPTPLKAIPTKSGEVRSIAKKASSAAAATGKNVRPKP